MKTILFFLIFLPFILNSQISRKFLDYQINDNIVIRRTCDKQLIFETDYGEITLTLYSDSVKIDRQTLNLLVCYPSNYRNINVKLIIQYEDKTEEVVPNFPDINNCAIYYFLNRLNFINYKKVKNITFLGIDKFDLEDGSYFINFIQKINR